MRYTALMLMAWVLTAWRPVAAEETPRCTSYEIPIDLEFVAATAEPEVHNTVTAVAIEVMAREQKVEDEDHHPSGVTVAETLIDLSSTSFALRGRSKEGGECIYLDHVKLAFGWRRHDIYVATEYQPGSCMYEAVLRHEREHAAINAEVLQLYAPRVKATLRDALDREEPAFEKRPGAAVQDAIARLDGSVNAVLADFQKKKAELNALLDTTENRLVTMRSCGATPPVRKPRIRQLPNNAGGDHR